MSRCSVVAIALVLIGCVNTTPPGQKGIGAAAVDTATVAISASAQPVPSAWVALGNRVYYCTDTNISRGIPPHIVCYAATLP